TSSFEGRAKESLPLTDAIQTPESRRRTSPAISAAPVERWPVVAYFSDDLGAFAAHRHRWTEPLFDLLAECVAGGVESFPGDAAKALLRGLASVVRDVLQQRQMIVGNLDLEPGHLARVSRGFG